MRDLPGSWRWTRLEDLAAPEPRAITDGPFGSKLKTEHYTDHGPRVIRLQNIGDGQFRDDDKAHISESRFATLATNDAVPGDLLIAGLGDLLPRACVVPVGLGPAIVKADCFRVRLAADVNPYYVAAALNSHETRRHAMRFVSGVGRPRLNLGKVRNLELPMAPSAEQGRIVAAIEEEFSRLDSATSALRNSRRHVETLRSSVLALVSVATGEWTTLGEVAEIVGGVTKDIKREQGSSLVERPYLRVANVQRGHLDLTEVSTIRVPKEKAQALRLEPGDILFNEGGDRDKLGRGWVWQGEIDNCIHQNHVFRARLTNGAFEPKFVSIHGNTFGSGWFERMGKQTTNLASINLRTLKAFPIPVLPIEEQRSRVLEVERQTAAMGYLVAEIERSDRRAAQLRSAILAAAFSGGLA